MESTPRWTSTGLKVIAFELGLIIAILTWIAFDGLPWSKPPQALVLPEITDQSVGLVSSIYQPVQRRGDQVDYLGDDLASEQWQAGGDDVEQIGYDRVTTRDTTRALPPHIMSRRRGFFSSRVARPIRSGFFRNRSCGTITIIPPPTTPVMATTSRRRSS